jgi:hypothetical protein
VRLAHPEVDRIPHDIEHHRPCDAKNVGGFVPALLPDHETTSRQVGLREPSKGAFSLHLAPVRRAVEGERRAVDARQNAGRAQPGRDPLPLLFPLDRKMPPRLRHRRLVLSLFGVKRPAPGVAREQLQVGRFRLAPAGRYRAKIVDLHCMSFMPRTPPSNFATLRAWG